MRRKKETEGEVERGGEGREMERREGECLGSGTYILKYVKSIDLLMLNILTKKAKTIPPTLAKEGKKTHIHKKTFGGDRYV